MRRARVAVLFVSFALALCVRAVNGASTIFVSLPPCRIADTRVAGGPIAGNTNRIFKVVGLATDFTSQGGSATGCGVPGFSGVVAQVQAIALNISAANHTGSGFVTAFAGDTSRPLASTLNFSPGITIANGVIVPVRQAAPEGNDLKVFVNVATDVFMDVTGYFTDITLVDGAGSGIDADTLDGLDSSAFGDITGVTAGTGLSGGATSGNATLNLNLAASNTWTGNTTFDPASGLAFATGSGDDIDLGGNVKKSGALFLHNNGTNNLGVGLSTLASNTTGANNTATGRSALSANTSGTRNTATGSYALKSNTTASYNTATGMYALGSNVTGSANSSLGYTALRDNTAGTGNSAFGYQAGKHITGSSNIAVGFKAGYNLNTGNNNIDVGNEGVADESAAIRVGTSGTQTKAFVAGIRGVSVSGGLPVVIDSSGQLGTTAGSSGTVTSVATDSTLTGGPITTSGTLGVNLAASNTWTGNTTFDPASGLAFSTGSGDDIDLGGNVMKGGTLFLHNQGTANLGVGLSALASNSTGSGNTALGAAALAANTAGDSNTAAGSNALLSNTTGGFNTATGCSALYYNTAGNFNTATGCSALQFNTSGTKNTASGVGALFFNTTGYRNTASGAFALRSNTTGSRNVVLGYRAGYNLTTGNDNILVGNQGVAAEGATIRIGTAGTQTKAFVAGIRGVTTGVADQIPVCIDSAGQLGTASCGSTGTVTSVATDSTLTGGPITTSGTLGVNLAASNTWTGNTTFNPASGLAFSTGTGDDIDLGGNVKKGGVSFFHNSGTNNLGVGLSALESNTTGLSNTAAGALALRYNTGGTFNTASGAFALRLNTNGSRNTAIGASALFSNTTGAFNTASGYTALFSNTGSYNTASGASALRSNTTGVRNSASGYNALLQNTTGDGNTASGAGALSFNTTGFRNTASGNYALRGNTTGFANTASGTDALFSNTTGSRNIASGNYALQYNTTGSGNTALGYGAGSKLTTGNDNIDIGNQGAAAEGATIRIGTSGTQTKAFVAGIRGVVTDAADAIPVLVSSTGQLGTAGGSVGDITGVAAGTGLSGGGTSGDVTLNLNLAASNTWTGNTTFDPGSGLAFSTGTGDDVDLGGNVKKGGVSFLHNVGTDNLGVGLLALSSDTTGYGNTASGAGALSLNTTGFRNTAIGNYALRGNTTGFANTASGTDALFSNTTGSRNIASGNYALQYNTTGSGNTALGYGAGSLLTTGNNNIDIGNLGVAAESAITRIGTSGTQTKAFVAGIVGVTTDAADAIPVLVSSTGQLGTVSSSRRYKEEIRDMGTVSERLLKLRPVTFRYRREVQAGERPVEFGLIAEEVADVFPELIVYNKDGKPETVKYHVLAPLLLNELQKQKTQVEERERALEVRLDQERVARQMLEVQLTEQREQFTSLLARLAAVERRAGPGESEIAQTAAPVSAAPRR